MKTTHRHVFVFLAFSVVCLGTFKNVSRSLKIGNEVGNERMEPINSALVSDSNKSTLESESIETESESVLSNEPEHNSSETTAPASPPTVAPAQTPTQAPTIKPPDIKVFYNLFTNSTKDRDRVQSIVNEQLSLLLTEHHTLFYITSIGYNLPLQLPNIIPNDTIIQHYETGNEGKTLHAIWEYCNHPDNSNHETKIVYMHSKGSYHDEPQNIKLRSFLTQGALSKECAIDIPDTCNVCSSRMSPLPHPHTPGNMWLARCDYIANLIDPFAYDKQKLHKNFYEHNSCRGFGRYFFEHWINSHPSVSPCDLYPGKEYIWGYENIPEVGDLVKEMKLAPRWFDIDSYKRPEYKNRNRCITTNKQNVAERMWNYEQLYNITASTIKKNEKWWGWKVFNVSSLNATS